MAGQAGLEAGAQPWKLTFAHWEAQIEGLRALAADLLFESDVEGVAMVPSAAFGISTAARNLPLQPGQEVLVLEGQFPSNLLPWQQRCTEVGAKVIAAKRELEEDWTEAVMRAWDRRTRLKIVSLPHTHWLDGSALNMDRIAQRARAVSYTHLDVYKRQVLYGTDYSCLPLRPGGPGGCVLRSYAINMGAKRFGSART